MAALNASHPGLHDVVTRMNSDGTIDTNIVELLEKQSPMIRDAFWMESSEMTGHRSHVRTSKPTPSWRKLNQVSSFDKSTTRPITDTVGILEKWFQMDAKAVKMQANPEAFLKSEHDAFVAAFADELESTAWLGNEITEPEAFTGIFPRYNSAIPTTDVNAENIFVESSSDTDATSIMLVDWGPQTVCMIYPRGSGGGIEIDDDGLVTAENHAGQTGPLKVFRKKFCWTAGLHVKDWRKISRFQFDPDDVTASGSSGPVLADTMRKMVRRVKPSPRARWYMNRDALDCFDLQGNNKGTLQLGSVTSAQGELVETFLGIPIRQCDAITTAETSIAVA